MDIVIDDAHVLPVIPSPGGAAVEGSLISSASPASSGREEVTLVNDMTCEMLDSMLDTVQSLQGNSTGK